MTIFNFQFFKRVGFYISLASIATLVAAVLSYINGFTDVLLEYNSDNVVMYVVIGAVAYFALLVFDPTSNMAPVALWISTFVAFLTYVTNIYMYFTGIFYNGVSAEAFGLIDPVVLVSTGLFVLAFLLSNVAMYLNHSATEEVE